MPKRNTENLTNKHTYHNNLAQAVDDAEWLEDDDSLYDNPHDVMAIFDTLQQEA